MVEIKANNEICGDEVTSNEIFCGLCKTKFNADGQCEKGHTCSVIKCKTCDILLKEGRCPNGCRQKLDRCEKKNCGKYLLFGKCSNGHDNTRCSSCNAFLKNGICHSQKCPKNKCKQSRCKGFYDFQIGKMNCWHTQTKCQFCKNYMSTSGTCYKGHDLVGSRCRYCNTLLEYGTCPIIITCHCSCNTCILPLGVLSNGKVKECPQFYCKFPGCFHRMKKGVCSTNDKYGRRKCKKCDVFLDHYMCPNYDHHFYHNCNEACFLADYEPPPKTEYNFDDVFYGDNFCPLGHNGHRCNSKVLKCLICDDSTAGEHECKYQTVRCNIDLEYGLCSVHSLVCSHTEQND